MDVNLLPYQFDFMQLTCPNASLTSGVGTGKTLTLAYMVIDMVSKYPNTKGMITANTYSQLVNSTLTPLFEILDEFNIPYKKNISGKFITIINTKIYVYSLEKFDSIRGIEIGWLFSDELAFQKNKMAYDTIKTRLRCKKGPLYFRAFTTKNGFNWYYDLYSSPTKKNNFVVIEAKTKENTFLPSQYLEDLLLDYGSATSPMFLQEVENKYISQTAGAVYHSFDREKHVKPVELLRQHHVYVGVDFNIDRLTGVFTQWIDNILYVGKEEATEEHNTNTWDLVGKLNKALDKFAHRSIVPDSTGKQRKSSSHHTDHQILRNAGYRLDITSNPLIRDRQNAVNRLFVQNRIVIDPSCTGLIKELETLAQRDKEGEVAHISVALGYVVNFLDPLKKARQKAKRTN